MDYIQITRYTSIEDTLNIASNMTCTKSTSSNCLSSTDILLAGKGILL